MNYLMVAAFLFARRTNRRLLLLLENVCPFVAVPIHDEFGSGDLHFFKLKLLAPHSVQYVY